MSDRYDDLPSFGRDKLLPQIKRVAAIHDISCLGRCALTVIIPTLSALGIQVVPLPTALLSTHTGGFQNMFFEDLTPEMEQIATHWKSMELDFDAIYTGFLGSERQIDLICGFVHDFCKKNDGTKTFIAVDPVMGDDGELYSTYTPELVEGMKKLCYGADLITPNLTEACFLTGEKYPDIIDKSDVIPLAKELCGKLYEAFGVKKIVLTGIDDGESITTASMDDDLAMNVCTVKRMPRSYPGTGDVFASVLLGDILSGIKLSDAVKRACEFVLYVTEFSSRYKTPIRDGLVIEPCLGELAHF